MVCLGNDFDKYITLSFQFNNEAKLDDTQIKKVELVQLRSVFNKKPIRINKPEFLLFTPLSVI